MGKVKLICFFGIDGSGKSTLSHYLRDELRRKNYHVSYTWWLEGENTPVRKLIRSKGNKSDGTGNVKSNANRGSYNRSLAKRLAWGVYQRIVLLDYLFFGINKTWISRYTGNNSLQIFDRYMYDVIFSLYKEFNMNTFRRDFLFRSYHLLLPKPDVIFFIDVPPEITYERKKDEIASIEEAKATYDNYQELYGIISSLNPGKTCRIDNTRELEMVKREILNKTLALMEGTHEE